MKKSILVGLSGGVDSAVTVKLLIEQGYDVSGLYLDMKERNDNSPILLTNAEGMSEDIASALQCAEKYGIKLYIYGCADQFDRLVKEDFARQYSLGRTPNPCIVCNRLVKFRMLLHCADMLGIDMIATGHYAKVLRLDSGRYTVKCAKDEKKDQTYMLWNLTQDQLSRCVFPLYDRVKQENLDTAVSDGLFAAERKESLDICFINKDDNYASFIERRLGKFPEGDFISPDGKVCGKHKGIIHYTVGQRKGLGIALGEPVFVKRIDGETGNIYLARSGEEYTSSITVRNLNFVGLVPTEDLEGEFDVKIRYAAHPQKAKVVISGEICMVDFPEPVRAATPGQSAVFYKDGCVMFGGFID